MSGATIEAIFITAAAGQPLRRLSGDRYALGTGYYCPLDVCEVTMIAGEVLDVISSLHHVAVRHGEHRRNIVTRGLDLRRLEGRQMRIDDVLLEYDCPRPPCGYVERLTEKGMTKALGEGAGIAVRVLNSGVLREGAEIEVVEIEGRRQRHLP